MNLVICVLAEMEMMNSTVWAAIPLLNMAIDFILPAFRVSDQDILSLVSYNYYAPESEHVGWIIGQLSDAQNSAICELIFLKSSTEDQPLANTLTIL